MPFFFNAMPILYHIRGSKGVGLPYADLGVGQWLAGLANATGNSTLSPPPVTSRKTGPSSQSPSGGRDCGSKSLIPCRESPPPV